MPIDDDGVELSSENAMEVDDLEPIRTKSYLHLVMVNLLKSAHSRAKVKEEAAICLGSLAIGDGEFFAALNLKMFINIVKIVSIDYQTSP